MTQETPDPRTENPDAARLPPPDAGAPARPPGPFARWIARGRTGFRQHVPPGWNWRRVVVAVVVGEVAIVLILMLFLALSGRELVVSFERPTVVPSPRLTIPVAGVLAPELEDSYGAPRTPTRDHMGIDIRAPLGTPVVAAAAGVIVRLGTNPAGGTTIYERSLDGRTVFYYAHLQRRVAGLAVGDLVRQGDTLAYVGDTGNASGIPHLHFAVYAVTDPNEVSGGRHLDPYPLLVDTPPDPER